MNESVCANSYATKRFGVGRLTRLEHLNARERCQDDWFVHFNSE